MPLQFISFVILCFVSFTLSGVLLCNYFTFFSSIVDGHSCFLTIMNNVVKIMSLSGDNIFCLE